MQEEFWLGVLQDIVGKDFVEVRSGHFYVQPADEQEVADVLTFATEYQLGVVPQGSGSQSGLGGRLRRQDLVLSLARLDRVLEYSPADLTVTVQAGLPLQRLQEHLAQHGQWLALDPVVYDTATIGGLIATNASGPKRLLYGALRDQVIGMRVAYPDGRIIKAGGKVMKNVAGYDMSKLFIGALGTLGVVLEATFKLRPLPFDPELVVISTPALSQAQRLQKEILGSELIPSALELLSPSMAEALGLAATYTIVVGCEEGKSSAEYQRQRLKELADHLAEGQVQVLTGESQAAFWQTYRELILANGQLTNERFLQIKVSLLPMQVVPFLEMATALQPHPLSVASSAGLGTGLVRLYVDAAHVPEQRLVAWLTSLRSYAEQRQGALVLEQASDAWKERFSVWGTERSDFALMKGVKQAIDPQGVLNAGRFVGGM